MASEETYNDTISEKVITKKELKKIMFRSYLLQSSFNYERMQAGGWTYSLIPGLKKIHRDKEDLALSLVLIKHLVSFLFYPNGVFMA